MLELVRRSSGWLGSREAGERGRGGAREQRPRSWAGVESEEDIRAKVHDRLMALQGLLTWPVVRLLAGGAANRDLWLGQERPIWRLVGSSCRGGI